MEKGYKEESNKLNYELDWDFIESLAKRMSKNKGKYIPYNWQKLIDIESLKQSLFRHVKEVMNGNYEDGEEYGHLSAIALNAMFLYYQLNKNPNEEIEVNSNTTTTYPMSTTYSYTNN